MLKIGVLGAGHLGKIHVKLILELPAIFQLVGFYDPNDNNAQATINQFGIKRYDSVEALLHEVDCIDIVTPTLAHYEAAVAAIKKSIHVFVEKPITQTIEEGNSLLKLANEADIKVQVGHVERFNPAFLKALPNIQNPMFIETHRLAQFNPRGTDVPVVLDLMIHDLDIILSIVKSDIKRITASGVAVVSDTPDIANARIEFNNGCVANLTASRISLKNMRKTRIFQKDNYISIDFLNKKLDMMKLEDLVGEAAPLDVVFELGNGKKTKKIHFDQPEIENTNAIKEELISFHQAITENKAPIVSIEDGLRALEVANQILDKLKSPNIAFADNNF
jgi:predicted dehydrogenase